MTKGKRFLLIVFSILVIGSSFWVFFSYFSKKQTQETNELLPKAPVVVVRAQLLNRKLQYYGTVVFSKKYDVYSKIKERIQTLKIEKGDRVRKGQLLVKLDDKEILLEMEKAQNEMARRQLDLNIAKESLEESSREIRKKLRSIEVLRKEKQGKELEIANMEKILSNKAELVKVGGFSEESYRQLETQYQQLLLDYEKIKDQLFAGEIGFRKSDLPVELRSKWKGDSLVENEELFVQYHTRIERLSLEKLQKEIEAYQLTYKQLQMQYENTFIYAPADGEVAERYMTEGEIALPDKPLLVIIDRGKSFIEFSVPESEINMVKVGSMVEAKVGGRTYKTRVDRIYPLVDEKTRMAMARCIFYPGQGEVYPGMFVVVAVEAGTRISVFELPASSIVERKDNQARVYIVNSDGIVVGRWVVIDSVVENRVYVTSGLSEGERVIRENVAQYKEGIKVIGVSL
jgi:RND family efflux transporter MFP subunit